MAEIHEQPGRLMAFDATAGRWPRPGEALFGLDPELFEDSTEEIYIRSCGYTFDTLTYDMFGFSVRDQSSIAIAQAIDIALDCDEAAGSEQAEILSAAKQILSAGVVPPLLYCANDVISPPLGSIAFVGYWFKQMVLREIDTRGATQCLQIYASAIGVAPTAIGEIGVSFWKGRGDKRMIAHIAGCHVDF